MLPFQQDPLKSTIPTYAYHLSTSSCLLLALRLHHFASHQGQELEARPRSHDLKGIQLLGGPSTPEPKAPKMLRNCGLRCCAWSVHLRLAGQKPPQTRNLLPALWVRATMRSMVAYNTTLAAMVHSLPIDVSTRSIAQQSTARQSTPEQEGLVHAYAVACAKKQVLATNHRWIATNICYMG